MSSLEDSDGEDIPDEAERQLMCEKLAVIAGKAEACAQMLQDTKWSLEQSVKFFEDTNNKGGLRVNDKEKAQEVLYGSGESLAAAATSGGLATTSGTSSPVVKKMPEKNPEKPVLKFITWNLNGLNEKNLLLRTKAACEIILNEQADIVFVQEVVPATAEYFRKYLTEYHCTFGRYHGYFIGTFLKKSTIKYIEHEILEFAETKMMRNCLKTKITYNDLSLCLFNSHIESTADGADARMKQLKFIFKEVLSTPADHTAIFAGDLSIREKELKKMGGLPAFIEDLWIVCGSRKRCAYTFDLTRNDNMQYECNKKFKPRCRFDRVYVRHSSPRKLKPVYFGFRGLERLLPDRCFPSDHFCILSHFEME